MSDLSSPTDKSKANLEAVYRNTHQEVDQEGYREVDQDSTEAICRECTHEVAYRDRIHKVDPMVTDADFER
jgi:hypothetical protein